MRKFSASMLLLFLFLSFADSAAARRGGSSSRSGSFSAPSRSSSPSRTNSVPKTSRPSSSVRSPVRIPATRPAMRPAVRSVAPVYVPVQPARTNVIILPGRDDDDYHYTPPRSSSGSVAPVNLQQSVQSSDDFDFGDFIKSAILLLVLAGASAFIIFSIIMAISALVNQPSELEDDVVTVEKFNVAFFANDKTKWAARHIMQNVLREELGTVDAIQEMALLLLRHPEVITHTSLESSQTKISDGDWAVERLIAKERSKFSHDVTRGNLEASEGEQEPGRYIVVSFVFGTHYNKGRLGNGWEEDLCWLASCKATGRVEVSGILLAPMANEPLSESDFIESYPEMVAVV